MSFKQQRLEVHMTKNLTCVFTIEVSLQVREEGVGGGVGGERIGLLVHVAMVISL